MTTPDRHEDSGGAEQEFDFSNDFDPLLTPWDESPARDASSTFDGPDGPGGPSQRAYASRRPDRRPEDALWWEAAPAAPYSPPHQIPARHPDSSPQPFAERLTEVQRRLREETIAIPRPERRWLVTVREVAETLLLAALIFLAVRASFQNFKVEGHSMDPSLADGQYLIVNKLTYAQVDLGVLDFLPFFDVGDDPHYLWGAPDRGDVIVFRAPLSPERDFIKRIVGLPGDTVEINETNGEVRVNGQPLTESYIQGATSCSQACTWTVPKTGSDESQQQCGSDRCYFVLGDNRQNSSDSRQGWLVPKENIVGKALITYWHEGSPDVDFAPNHSVGIADQASAEQ